MQQLRQYLHKTLSKEMMKTAVAERFRSVSYISFDHNWCQLYRGHPITGAISQEKLEQSLGLTIGHIKGTQTFFITTTLPVTLTATMNTRIATQ